MSTFIKNKLSILGFQRRCFSQSFSFYHAKFDFVRLFERKTKEAIVDTYLNPRIEQKTNELQKPDSTNIFTNIEVEETSSNQVDAKQSLETTKSDINQNSDIDEKHVTYLPENYLTQKEDHLKKMQFFFQNFNKIRNELKEIERIPEFCNLNLRKIKHLELECAFYESLKSEFYHSNDLKVPFGFNLEKEEYSLVKLQSTILKNEISFQKLQEFLNDSDLDAIPNIELLFSLISRIPLPKLSQIENQLRRMIHRIIHLMFIQMTQDHKNALFNAVWFCSLTPLVNNQILKKFEFIPHFVEDVSRKIKEVASISILELFPNKKFNRSLFVTYLCYFNRMTFHHLIYDQKIVQKLVDLAENDPELDNYSHFDFEQIFYGIGNLHIKVNFKSYIQKILKSKDLRIHKMDTYSLSLLRKIAIAADVFNYNCNMYSYPQLRQVLFLRHKILGVMKQHETNSEHLLNLLFLMKTSNNSVYRLVHSVGISFGHSILTLQAQLNEINSQYRIETIFSLLNAVSIFFSIFQKRDDPKILFLILKIAFMKMNVVNRLDFKSKEVLISLLKNYKEKFINTYEQISFIFLRRNLEYDNFERQVNFYDFFQKQMEIVMVSCSGSLINSIDLNLVRMIFETFDIANDKFRENYQKIGVMLLDIVYKENSFSSKIEKLELMKHVLHIFENKENTAFDKDEENKIISLKELYHSEVMSLDLTLVLIFKFCVPFPQLFVNDKLQERIFDIVSEMTSLEQKPFNIPASDDFKYSLTVFENFRNRQMFGFEKILILMKTFECDFPKSLYNKIIQKLMKYATLNTGTAALDTLLIASTQIEDNTSLVKVCLENVLSNFTAFLQTKSWASRAIFVVTDQAIVDYLKNESRFKHILNFFVRNDCQLDNRNQKIAISLMYFHFIFQEKELDLFILARLFQIMGKKKDQSLVYFYSYLQTMNFKFEKLNPFTMSHIHYDAMSLELQEKLLELINESISRKNDLEIKEWFMYCFHQKLFYLPLIESILNNLSKLEEFGNEFCQNLALFEVPSSFAKQFYSKIFSSKWIAKLPTKIIFRCIFNMQVTLQYAEFEFNNQSFQVDASIENKVKSLFNEHAIVNDGLNLITWNSINQQHYYHSFNDVVPPIKDLLIDESFPVSYINAKNYNNLKLERVLQLELSSVDSDDYDYLCEKFVQYYLVRMYFTELSEKYRFQKENILYFQYAFEAVSNAFCNQTIRRIIKFSKVKVDPGNVSRLAISKMQTISLDNKKAIIVPEVFCGWEVSQSNRKNFIPWVIGKMFAVIEINGTSNEFSKYTIINTSAFKEFLASKAPPTTKVSNDIEEIDSQNELSVNKLTEIKESLIEDVADEIEEKLE